MVKIQAQTMLPATPQRTAEALRTEPTPTMAPVMVCVVDTGIPSAEARKITIDPAVEALNPWCCDSLVIREPIVSMIFHPPVIVPMAIATGTGAEVQKPLATVVVGGRVLLAQQLQELHLLLEIQQLIGGRHAAHTLGQAGGVGAGGVAVAGGRAVAGGADAPQLAPPGALALALAEVAHAGLGLRDLLVGQTAAGDTARAERLAPDVATTAFMKADRGGKVFVDATRVGGATVVAAYSRRYLDGDPGHADALHYLGLIGKTDISVVHFQYIGDTIKG